MCWMRVKATREKKHDPNMGHILDDELPIARWDAGHCILMQGGVKCKGWSLFAGWICCSLMSLRIVGMRSTCLETIYLPTGTSRRRVQTSRFMWVDFRWAMAATSPGQCLIFYRRCPWICLFWTAKDDSDGFGCNQRDFLWTWVREFKNLMIWQRRCLSMGHRQVGELVGRLVIEMLCPYCQTIDTYLLA